MKRLLFAILFALASSSAFAQQVTVEWTNAVDARITGTRIERKLGSCTSTDVFVKIGSVATGVVTYLDVAVVAGQTYAYRARHAGAVDAAGSALEYSEYSNCASITIPTGPISPPTNLRVS